MRQRCSFLDRSNAFPKRGTYICAFHRFIKWCPTDDRRRDPPRVGSADRLMFLALSLDG